MSTRMENGADGPRLNRPSWGRSHKRAQPTRAMKRTLRVLPEAEDELQSAAIWYENRRRGLGVEFMAEVDQALQSVLERPESSTGWRRNRPYGKHPLSRFPYVVFFRIDPATLEIVPVAHAKRRPGYWLDR